MGWVFKFSLSQENFSNIAILTLVHCFKVLTNLEAQNPEESFRRFKGDVMSFMKTYWAGIQFHLGNQIYFQSQSRIPIPTKLHQPSI